MNTFHIESCDFEFLDDKESVFTVKSNIKQYSVYIDDNNSIEDNVVETEQDNLENSSDDEKKQDI